VLSLCTLNDQPHTGAVVASHRTALDGKATRWEPPGRLNLKASSVRQFSEFRERAVLTSQQDHHQQLGVSSAIRGHSAQDHQAAAAWAQQPKISLASLSGQSLRIDLRR
jgi:hypothetical protein